MVAVQDAKVYMTLVKAVFDVQVYCLDVDFEKLTDRCQCLPLLWNSVCQPLADFGSAVSDNSSCLSF